MEFKKKSYLKIYENFPSVMSKNKQPIPLSIMCVLIPELTGNIPKNSLVPFWNHQWSSGSVIL